MSTVTDKIADISRWWIAMVIVSFGTGILMALYQKGTEGRNGLAMIGLLASLWLMSTAARKHYERNRARSQVNSLPALALTGVFAILLVMAFIWQWPPLLLGLLGGLTATSLALLGKNATVAVYLQQKA